ncbi:MAG: hypothetical protein MUC91_13520, partial [Verrucomicrobia bacterium]|nr:hypothetical protein [Verrucomicrobiota bacterium]
MNALWWPQGKVLVSCVESESDVWSLQRTLAWTVILERPGWKPDALAVVFLPERIALAGIRQMSYGQRWIIPPQ